MTTDLTHRVLGTVRQYNMLNKGDRLLVCLSGGADSTALLRVMLSLRSTLSITLSAVHINHQLRAEESERDEIFVRDLCESFDIPLSVYRVDVAAYQKQHNAGVELAARALRYECFERAANGGKIATAHTLNDNAETLVFNISRGSGIAGAGGIPPVRDRIIRPLMDCSRDDILRYLEQINQSYVTDSSNMTDDYTRNNIRHNILPQLCGINPSFLQAAARLCESARTVQHYLSHSAAVYDDAPLSTLQTLDDALLLEYIGRLCEKNGLVAQYSQRKIALSVIRQGRGAAQLCGNRFLYICGDMPKIGTPPDESFAPFCVDFTLGELKTPYDCYFCSVISVQEYKKIKKINTLFLNSAIDYDKMGKNIVMRSRQSGDRIAIGKRVTKTLKALHNEAALSAYERVALAVLCDEQGIIWAQRFGTARRCEVTDSTNRVLIITTNNIGS